MWAQHGHGAAGMGGHGAAPAFTPSNAAAGSHAATGKTGSDAGARAAFNNPASGISSNPAIAAHVQPLLPAGMTLQMAASGFRSQGQFLATLHVAHNLNIPFQQLKTDITGPTHDSLGQAIQALRPNMSSGAVKNSVKLADHEARQDLRAGTPATVTIASRITANPALSTRVTSLLPAGVSLQTATMGFRNEGQFLAALHVAHDLNLSFTSLQAQVASGQSLGHAIATLRPNMNTDLIHTDVRIATLEAHADLEAASA
jgi:hypothetical protein